MLFTFFCISKLALTLLHLSIRLEVKGSGIKLPCQDAFEIFWILIHNQTIKEDDTFKFKPNICCSCVWALLNNYLLREWVNLFPTGIIGPEFLGALKRLFLYNLQDLARIFLKHLPHLDSRHSPANWPPRWY